MIKKETIKAGIIGSIVADALGVPYEFRTKKEMRENPATTMTGYGTYNQPPGTWSDDSSMTLATMDSLTKGINYEDMITKFSQWIYQRKYTPHNEVFDYGNTTIKAINNYYKENMPPLESGLTNERSNGNGSLMRILPATLYAYSKQLKQEEQIKFINNVSALTHAHPISKASCNIYNYIIQEILENPDKKLKETIQEGIKKSGKHYDNSEYTPLQRIYGNIFQTPDEIISSTGYVVDSLEVAIYSCYHTNNYKEAVLKSINYGGDTDTNAIITAGIAALHYGYNSIPEEWIKQVAKIEYINELCEKFYQSLKT